MEQEHNSGDETAKGVPKVCGVCGDKALGYNFNAMTCESCKAFFRRNALKNKEFKCPFSDNCEVTVVTRRFCQKCRLKKCFDIGMKKEWILSDEEKQQKKQKIEENRAKKRHHSGGANSFDGRSTPTERPQARVLPNTRTPEDETKAKHIKYEPYSSSSSTSPHIPPSEDSVSSEVASSSNQLISNQLALASVQPNNNHVVLNANEQIRMTVPVPNPELGVAPHSASFMQEVKREGLQVGTNGEINNRQQLPVADFSQQMLSQENLDSVVSVAIHAEFQMNPYVSKSSESPSTSSTTVSSSVNLTNSLNERELAELQELFDACGGLEEPLELPPELERPGSQDPLISVINLTDLAIKRIIKMAKKISPFINMCQEDQIALLKGGCTELLILRALINYDQDKNSWRLPSKDSPRELSMDVLKGASQLGVNLYEEHQRFVKTFDPKWRADENVMLLLSAIALFTPERSNVIHKDVIKFEQDTYYFLLRRYLETTCSGCDARRVYLNLISRLQDLHRLNESHIQLFLEVNPKQVEPLLIEIFDLKPGQYN